jgi:anti-anti-sigma factor
VSGFGEVFDVNLRDTTLVVVPARERLSHNYADLQHEMQLLVQQVQRPQVQHVIFDLGGVEYVGSEVIGVIVHISKQVCDGGGRAAMCNADYKMHRVLDSMQLFNLWPYYDTFPEALEAIDKTSTPEGDAGPPPENDGHVLIEDEDPIESASESVITLDWLGSLFAVAREESALVVSPLIRGGMFEYTQLHTESNALLRKLDHPELEALVIDLGQVEYSGSELIGVIVKLGRKMTDDGRKAVLCNASSHMRNVLCKMSLDQLWPMFDSRQQALSSVFR